jgi:hypothetical protein
MPWLTIIMALLSYLMSPRNTPAERRQAVANGILAGGLTYTATHYTDWGQENLGAYDGVATPSAAVTGSDGSVSGVAGAARPVSSGGSAWGAINGWFKDGLVAVGAVGLASTVSKWLPFALAGLAAWYFLKDSGSSKVVVARGE